MSLEGRWGGLAGSYRRQIWLERMAVRRLVGMLDMGPSDEVLDVATGPGVLLAELAKGPAPPLRACGVDSSPEMLALAPALPDGWEVRVADAMELPFDADSFDVVTASYLLHFLEETERRRILGEARRVLRPGGRLGVITVAPPRWRLAAPIRAAAERSSGRLAAMRGLDPSPDLEVAGLRVLARARTWLGYPSLCLVAG